MPDTIHRLIIDLFHRYSGTHPHQALPTPQRGIPDGYMEKVPPPDERTPEDYYARDTRTQQFIETLQLQDHAA
jgi:hypothetical protein